jgi:hypothetical protein
VSALVALILLTSGTSIPAASMHQGTAIYVGTVGASSAVVTCVHVSLWLCHLCRDSQGSDTCLGSLHGLEGYAVVANLMAYPGRAGVYTVPTPIQMRV